MKYEIRFEHSLALSIVEFSAAKERSKMMKEAGIYVDQKGKAEDTSLKKRFEVHLPIILRCAKG